MNMNYNTFRRFLRLDALKPINMTRKDVFLITVFKGNLIVQFLNNKLNV